MNADQELYDVTIIGGGPAGLFAAYYSGMRALKTKVIEAKGELGGKVAQFYPEKHIYDIGGIPAISGTALIRQMEEQAARHQPDFIYNQLIETVEKQSDGNFLLVSDNGEIHYSKTIIIATGMGSYHPVPLAAEGASAVEGSHLHYTIGDPAQFAEKEVVIFSNSRVGVDWALTIESIAKKIILVNDKDKFQHVSEADIELLKDSSIEVKMSSTITKLVGENGKLQYVSVFNQTTNKTEQLTAADLLVYQGIQLNTTPLEKWGLQVERNRMTVNTDMAANVPGIFAAGDVVVYPHKPMLIASAYTEVITAINSAKLFLDPKASPQVYSTVVYRDNN